MVSNMAKLTGYTENGSIRSVNGGFHRRETKSRQSATPPVRNIFMPPEPKSKNEKNNTIMSWARGPSCLCEYETPRVVTVRHIPLGILKLVMQICVLAFVLVFQLWHAKGYQTFAQVESSVTTKVKGLSYSLLLQNHQLSNMSKERQEMYERIWDEADYVIPPSENNAFFVMTNVVITPNQTRNICPEDHFEIPDIICDQKPKTGMNVTSYNHLKINQCEKGRIFNHKSHGRETGNCVKSDRDKSEDSDVYACEITGWCPVELDILPMADQPLIQGTEKFTVLIKNAISFPWFDIEKYRRNNMPNGICMYKPQNESTHLCPIFRLGDIVELAGGNYSTLALKGGVISIDINWDCNLDWNFDKFCLPVYNFVILDDSGWNFRHGKYHEENRRTLTKAYGLKFLLNVSGNAGKFDLTKTVIILVTGLGLMGLANILCDFVLLNCSHEFRKQVMEKKYEAINPSLDEKAITENLKTLLQKGDTSNDVIKSMMAMSSIALLPGKKESAPLAKEENCEEFL